MVQKVQWPIWENISPVILGPGFNPYQSFDWSFICLITLTNLTNLLIVRSNLGKIQLVLN